MNRDVSEYIVQLPGKISSRNYIRDILFTFIAWLFWCGLCIEVLKISYSEFSLFLKGEALFSVVDWEHIKNELWFAYRVGRFIILVYVLTVVFHVYWFFKSRQLRGVPAETLTLEKEVTAYGCSDHDVKQWRNFRIMTARVGDNGHIIKMTPKHI